MRWWLNFWIWYWESCLRQARGWLASDAPRTPEQEAWTREEIPRMQARVVDLRDRRAAREAPRLHD